MESHLTAVGIHTAILTLKFKPFIFLDFQVDRLAGQQTGMVIRLSTETEEDFSDLKSELDKVQVHDIRSSFYYSWASQSIFYKNISVDFEPRLSTAKVVKITAVYGKSFILIILIIYPRYLLIHECLPFCIYIYTMRFIGELTLRRTGLANPVAQE